MSFTTGSFDKWLCVRDLPPPVIRAPGDSSRLQLGLAAVNDGLRLHQKLRPHPLIRPGVVGQSACGDSPDVDRGADGVSRPLSQSLAHGWHGPSFFRQSMSHHTPVAPPKSIFKVEKNARRGRGRDPHPCSAASMINPAPAPVIGSISHPSLAVVPQRHAGSGGQTTPEWRFRAAISKWDSTPIRDSLRSPHGPYVPVPPYSADVNDAAAVREPTARSPNSALRPSNPLLKVSAADAHSRQAALGWMKEPHRPS